MTAVLLAAAAGQVWLGAQDCNENGVPDALDLMPRGLSFPSSAVLDTERHPVAITAFDLDGDGDPDLASANDTTDTVAVFVNDGGRLAPPVRHAVGLGYQGRAIVPGDLDSDGLLDLAASSFLSRRLSLLRQGQPGALARWQEITFEDRQPGQLEAADMDMDGDRDLVTVTTWPESFGTLFVLANDSRGTFSRAQVIDTGCYMPSASAAADLDGDHLPDLALGCTFNGPSVALFINGQGGAGNLVLQGVVSVPDAPKSLAARDLDADGDIDIAAGTGDGGRGVVVLRNLGGGTFEAGPVLVSGQRAHLAAADLDSDGDQDLAVAVVIEPGVQALFNDGAGGFGRPVGLTVPYPVLEVAPADFDGDSVVDLAAASRFPHAVVLLRGARAPVESDCDGNGVPDSCDARGADCNSNGVPDPCDARREGADRFRETARLETWTSPGLPLAVDFGADGRLDFAFLEREGASLAVARNAGGAAFGGLDRYPVPGDPESLAAADLSGDGVPDLAVLLAEPHGVEILLGGRDGAFRSWQDLPLEEGGPRALAAGDLQGDGRIDLLVVAQEPAGCVLTVFRNDGGSFQPEPPFPFKLFEDATVLIEDIDSSGDLDALVAGHGVGRYVGCLRRGPGDYLVAALFELAGGGRSAPARGDLDSDGDPDLALESRGRAYWMRNDRGRFAPEPLAPGLRVEPHLAAADFGGDGALDIALTSGLLSSCTGRTLTVSVLEGGGPPGFGEPRAAARLSGALRALLPGDWDADGRADLVAFDDGPTGAGLARVLVRDQGARSADCDSNGVPDECQADCDRNLVADACDIEAQGDCNRNGIPDACDLEGLDANANGIPDDCDIEGGKSADCNANGLPDEAELEPALSFAAVAAFRVEPRSTVAVADLDSDGDLDVVSFESGDCCPPARLWVHRNDGAGAFRPHAFPAAGARWTAAAAGDFDGDGAVDVAAGAAFSSCEGATPLSFFLNRGGEGFEGRRLRMGPGEEPREILVGDFDGVGGEDITASIEIVNAASRRRLLVVAGGPGGPAAGKPIEVPSRSWTAAGDLDGDRDLDLAVDDGRSGVLLLFNDGAARFPGRADLGLGEPSRLGVVSDLDGDGLDDLLVASGVAARLLLLRQAGGLVGFSPSRRLDPGVDPDSLLAYDLDGDGDSDIAASGRTPGGDPALGPHATSLLLNSGGGAFARAGLLETGTRPRRLFPGDFDGDHLPDLLALEPEAGSVWLLRSRGPGEYALPLVRDAAEQPASIAAADLDGDALADAAVAGAFAVTVLQARGGFASRAEYPAGMNPVAIVAADLDSDGDPDLATPNALPEGDFPDSVSVFHNAGGGRLDPPRNYAVGRRPREVLAQDFDGDGDVDLMAVNRDSRDLALLANDGRGAFAARPAQELGFYPSPAAVAGDFDGDGDADVAVASDEQAYADASVVVLLNAGAGILPISTRLGVRQGGVALATVQLAGQEHPGLAVVAPHWLEHRWPCRSSRRSPSDHPGGGTRSRRAVPYWRAPWSPRTWSGTATPTLRSRTSAASSSSRAASGPGTGSPRPSTRARRRSTSRRGTPTATATSTSSSR
ncbi:MAG: VCBS repeat-containing protein [Planctomycetes bacterium]|nr:VCBS repeat-containing protein [Planctomycetota bacterium]